MTTTLADNPKFKEFVAKLKEAIVKKTKIPENLSWFSRKIDELVGEL